MTANIWGALKAVADFIWWVGIVATLVLLAYFAGLGLHWWPSHTGFWP